MKTEKTYNIEFVEKNGRLDITRKNHGFEPFELLGILEFIQMEVIKQMEGSIKPGNIRKQTIEIEENDSNL